MPSECITTMPQGFTLPSPENDYDLNLLKEIGRVGWYNIHVNAEDHSPAFAFTIGYFYTSNHPEIIVIGLKPNNHQRLLNTVAVKVFGAKEKIEPYRKYADLTERLSVMFIPVSLEYYGEYLQHYS